MRAPVRDRESLFAMAAMSPVRDGAAVDRERGCPPQAPYRPTGRLTLASHEIPLSRKMPFWPPALRHDTQTSPPDAYVTSTASPSIGLRLPWHSPASIPLCGFFGAYWTTGLNGTWLMRFQSGKNCPEKAKKWCESPESWHRKMQLNIVSSLYFIRNTE